MQRDDPHLPEAGTQALLFDCDGTLADTMPAHYRAWLRVTGAHGITFDETRFYAMGGRPTRDIVATLARDGVWSYAYYDKLGRQTAAVDALGYLTTWERDNEGNVTTEVRYATATSVASASASSVTRPAKPRGLPIARRTSARARTAGRACTAW